ncbi:MAG: hypothetical protein KBH11_04195 [Bacteroidia bacterium]|jgi:hypothetical protein|nr:hypothetical protein [Bacteroidota bacterium]MBK8872681.1 hypothetical protein [Bacteroidota bacterium]MBL7915238.1 hypothetical protein [Bacteroidia bacterium]MBP9082252.1 hypothetical protein [Bacteroidia bacterium]
MKAPKLLCLSLFMFMRLITACNKNEDSPPAMAENTTVTVAVKAVIDNLPLIFDSVEYQNQAGNIYTVNKLQFYLSRFKLWKDGILESSSDSVVYIDMSSNNGNFIFSLSGIKYGEYDALSFCVGLDSLHNISNSLTPSADNFNMAWPDQMGGGYHFMKLEGKFKASGMVYGLAIHLGKNAHLVTNELEGNFTVNSSRDTIQLNMNINEWFRVPEIYDFNIDGNYSMGSDNAMLKLCRNGEDVFGD